MRLARVVAGVAVAGVVLAWWPPVLGQAAAMGTGEPASVCAASAGQLSFVGQVKLGGGSAVANWPGGPVTQGPDGSVYFAKGSAISEVKALAGPVVVLHAPGAVLALAATANDLYVEVGQKIDDYGLATTTLRRSWTLPAIVQHVTLAGLLAEPGVLWSWSDWATDESGFEYASVVEISTTTSIVRVIANNTANPVYMAASAGGLYYENVDTRSSSLPRTYLVHALPDGTQRSSGPINTSTFEPLALWPGYVAVLADEGPSGTPYLGTYSSSTLAALPATKLAFSPGDVVGTPNGLLAIDGLDVVYVNPGTGTTCGGVEVPGAWKLLFGPHPSVLATYQGTDYLVRLS